jgi:hypothetical protein
MARPALGVALGAAMGVAPPLLFGPLPDTVVGSVRFERPQSLYGLTND